MQRWNRTVLNWDLRTSTEIKTTLPVITNTGKIEKGKTQRLFGLRAVSLPARRGRIEVGINPSVNFTSHAGEHHILNRFTKLLEDDRRVGVYRGTWGEGAWPPLIFNFTLHDGESFCDTAIDIIEAILKRAGVQDEHNYWLGHFTLKQDTFVKFENGWISFIRWLRIQHKLPLDYVGDDRAVTLVEERDLA